MRRMGTLQHRIHENKAGRSCSKEAGNEARDEQRPDRAPQLSQTVEDVSYEESDNRTEDERQVGGSCEIGSDGSRHKGWCDGERDDESRRPVSTSEALSILGNSRQDDGVHTTLKHM